MIITYRAFITCQGLCEIFYVHLLKSQTFWRAAVSHPNCTDKELSCPVSHHYVDGQKQRGNPETNNPKSMVLTTFIFSKQTFHNKTISKNVCTLVHDMIPRSFIFPAPRKFCEATFQAFKILTSATSTRGEKKARPIFPHGFLTTPGSDPATVATTGSSAYRRFFQ